MTFIEKRHVRLQNTQVVGYDENGRAMLADHVVDDYVPVTILDAYLEDARTRWQFADVVADAHDPGPAGDDGFTHYPHHISHGHPHQGLTVDRHGNVQEG